MSTVPAVAAAKDRDVDWVDLESGHDLRNEIQAALQNSGGALANKYLYLGTHGAQAWVDVEQSPTFHIKQQASAMLQQHLGDVIREMRECSDDAPKGVDIVSLGTGTGRDDRTILTEFAGCQPGDMALFTLDLSIDLLRRAVSGIQHYLGTHATQRRRTQLHAMCADIAQLGQLAPYIARRGKNKHALYHLLGLTLGNNNELSFLRGISAAMREGDFLLLGVDFCLDDPTQRQKSIASYRQTQSEIMRFLSGPLVSVLQVDDSDVASGHIRLQGDMRLPSGGEWDYARNGIWIVTKDIQDSHLRTMSDVPGALTLARYYVTRRVDKDALFDPFEQSWAPFVKLCDFSNKYRSAAFQQFLTSNEHLLGLRLVNRDIAQWRLESQALVLLQKQAPETYAKRESALVVAERVWKNLDELFARSVALERLGLANEARALQALFKSRDPGTMARVQDLLASPLLDQGVFNAIGTNEEKARDYCSSIRQAIGRQRQK